MDGDQSAYLFGLVFGGEGGAEGTTNTHARAGDESRLTGTGNTHVLGDRLNDKAKRVLGIGVSESQKKFSERQFTLLAALALRGQPVGTDGGGPRLNSLTSIGGWQRNTHIN